MKTPPSLQKLHGGYYTPAPLAGFLVEWAIKSPSTSVLEPSCGDGVFLEAVVNRLLELGISPDSISSQITAVEINPEEADKAGNRLRKIITNHAAPSILKEDFFKLCESVLAGRKFDSIVGNPPFIRYQNFPESYREAAFRLMKQSGLHPNRLTNAWLPFVVLATEMLTDHGRLAMVVPAELLQVNYAAELREFLSKRFARLTIFTFRHLVFEGIQQEVVLLCGECDGKTRTGIRTIEINALEDLRDYEHTPFDRSNLKPMDHSSEKWTQYFLSKPQIYALRKAKRLSRLRPLGELANVDVGVVTGLNDFFVLHRSILDSVGANDYTTPLVARSGHLSGILFSRHDWEQNANNDFNAYLLAIPKIPKGNLPNQLLKYIEDAESKGWHKGYKCRIRDPWFKVPSIWIPDAFMLRQIHNAPRIIVNDSQATSTDTIHRVRMNPGIDPYQLAGSAYNSLTFALAEVMGRSYGGGVLELEPREAEQLLVPYEQAKNINFNCLNELIKCGDIEKALDYSDSVLLIQGLGLKASEVRQFRSIWRRLRERRTNRKIRKVNNVMT